MEFSTGVVVPAYNAGQHIEAALASVLAQTKSPDEVVIVDDGSTDDTGDIASHWIRRAGIPARLLRQANQGPAAARNAGIAALRVNLVAQLDADDIWDPELLERLTRPFAHYPDLTLAFGNMENFPAESRLKPTICDDTLLDDEPFTEDADGFRLLTGSLYSSLLLGNYMPLSAIVLSRDAVSHVGGYDTGLRSVHDVDLLMRLSRIGQFCYCPEVLARRRIHAGNITHASHAIRNKRNLLRVYRKALGNADGLRLTPAERAATVEAYRKVGRELYYVASRDGLPALVRERGFIRRELEFSVEVSAKDLLRAAVFTLR